MGCAGGFRAACLAKSPNQLPYGAIRGAIPPNMLALPSEGEDKVRFIRPFHGISPIVSSSSNSSSACQSEGRRNTPGALGRLSPGIGETCCHLRAHSLPPWQQSWRRWGRICVIHRTMRVLHGETAFFAKGLSVCAIIIALSKPDDGGVRR